MKNKKKFLICSFMIFIGVIITITYTEAHSPTNMTLSYNTDTQILSVTITHLVSNPDTHYIERVEIRITDNLTVSQDYVNQPNADTFTYNYNIAASNGVSISVFAQCNLSGNISKTLIVGGSTESIPGFIGFMFIFGFTMVISIAFLIKKHKYI